MWKKTWQKSLIFIVAALFALLPAAGLANWPMAGADPARTSWVTEQVTGDLDIEWYIPIESYISQKVQVVVTAGRAYVSTSRGLYAFDAANGATEWVFPTEVPLGHSPTVVNGVVYVGGFDRHLYAIDAASGSMLWSFQADAGFQNNPVVVNDVVYIGSRDGKLYAIHAEGTPNEGTEVWASPFQAGGPILFSPAYADAVVYIAANDGYAYAVNASTGAQVWKSPKLPTGAFQSWWPVVAGDKLLLYGAENYGSNRGLNAQFLQQQFRVEIFNDPDPPDAALSGEVPGVVVTPTPAWANGNTVYDYSLANTSAGAQAVTSQYFESKPYRRTFFVLNRSNGNEVTYDFDGDQNPEYAPIVHADTQGGTPHPPIVAPDGIIYTFAGYFHSGSYIPRGGLLGWKPDTPYMMSLNHDRAIDEPVAAAGGGDLIYNSLCCMRVGSSVSTTGSGGGNYWGYGLYNELPDLWTYYRLTSADPTGPRITYGTWNGVYGLHADNNPPVPYNGKVYVHRMNHLLCLSSTGGRTKLSDATIQTPPATPQTLTVADLEALLEAETDKMVAAGHLRPGHMPMGFTDLTSITAGDDLTDYFHEPGETIRVLCRALAHLPGAKQTALQSYIQSEFNSFPPYTYVHIGWNSGAKREAFDTPPEVQSAFNGIGPQTRWEWWVPRLPCWHKPPQANYAMYKYAQVFGNASTMLANQVDMFTDMPNDTFFGTYPSVLNAYIAGFYGLKGLYELDSQTPPSSITNELNRLLALRVSTWTKDRPDIADLGGGGLGNWYQEGWGICWNFMYLVPELAQYLHDNLLSQVQNAMNEYDSLAPLWFVARAEEGYGENGFAPLQHSHSLLQTKALILQEPFEELVKWLDVPGFEVGDLYYIENLVNLIEAQSGGNLAPTVDAGNNQTITLPDDDINLDGTVNDDGQPDPPATVTVTWTKDSGSGTVTFGNANAVDTTATFSTDGVYVLKLTADDSEKQSYDTVTITVNPAGGTNQAPTVDAGNNTSITLPDNDVDLDGTVNDDGLPDPPATVTQTWTTESGPGTVNFANANAVDTSATFSTDGVYVLRLTADDSELQTWDEVTITVYPDTGGDLPAPWLHQDVGPVGIAGDASYSSGTFTVDGAGADIWGTADEMHFAYQSLSGDGEIIARVASQENTNAWAKAGVMIRETLDAGSVHAFSFLTPGNGVGSSRRYTTDGTTSGGASGAIVAPYWVKLVRTGNVFQAYNSPDGSDWTQHGVNETVNMATNVYIGLAVGSHNTGALCTVQFDNVSVSGGAAPDTTPPTPDPLTWATVPYSTGSTSVSMTATTASDPSGVEYFFDCTAGGGNDSEWQDSTTYEDTGLSPSTQYTYRVQARDKSTNQNTGGWSTSESATTDATPDTTPPTPNPLTWVTVPYSTGTTSISMTATTASDPSGVEYFFDCTAGGGHDSGWQDSTTYQDTGLTPDTQYTYRVQARDKSTNQNTGGWSTSESATTDATPDTTPPTPDPLTWASVPASTGTTSISMTAATASDPSGVEYYFECTAGGGNDSGWQAGTTYQDTGLSPDTQYTYRVKARDLSTNQNETGWSTSESATTDPATGVVTDLPGRLEPEDYKPGGEGVDYHDTTPGNLGNATEFTDDVDVGNCPEGGYHIGYIQPTEWLDLDVNVAQTGLYTVTARVATDWAGTRSLHLEVGGQDVSGPIEFTTDAGGGWTNFFDVNVPDVNLTAGTYEMRICMDAGDFNFNYLDFTFQGAPDTTAPTPDPLTWATLPHSTGTTSISMTATTASDPSGVEYYFDCTAGGGNDSGWQDTTTYEDTGLSPGTQYTYRVQSRDKSPAQNATGWSTSESATTDTPADTTPPTPDPLTWASVPASTGTTSISMTATTASDPSGVEYYFDCTAGGGNDSGWQDGTTYEDTGLTPGTQYSYRVQARDKSANQNAGGWSTTESATTDAEGALPWSDDFESANLNNWTVSGGASASTQAAYTGAYGAKLPGTGWIEKAISTEGYTGIHVKYARKTKSMDSGEYLYAEWFDGTDWNQLEATNATSWSFQDMTCASGANNNASFKVRFRTNPNKTNEYGAVDDVEITGSAQ